MAGPKVRWPALCMESPITSASSCSAAATMLSVVWRSPR